jgi:predicted nucleic acid-binding protein
MMPSHAVPAQVAAVQSALLALLSNTAPAALPHILGLLERLNRVPHLVPVVNRAIDMAIKSGSLFNLAMWRRALLAAVSEHTSETLAKEWLRLTPFRLPARRPTSISHEDWKRLRAVGADHTA